MNQIYPDAGLVASLVKYVAGGFNYHLFVNDWHPSLADTLANYTEAAWSGYAPIVVNDGQFIPSVVVNHIAQIEAPIINFGNTSTAVQNVFGYFVTDTTNAILFAAARFDNAPRSIPINSAQPVLPAFGTYSGLTV